jgi:hypothetical protein
MKIEAMIVDGVVYDVVESNDCMDCDHCAFYGKECYELFISPCSLPLGHYFKRKETKDEQ